VALFFLRKKFAPHEKVKTFASKMNRSVWQAVLLGSIFLYAGGIFKASISLGMVLAIISLMMGIAYFVSSAVTGYQWMRILSFGWWIGMVLLFLLPPKTGPALLTLMVFLFEFIPGVYLYNAWKKQQVKTATAQDVL
jgi:hypothetical protein